tara:strand:+ start:1635 stop:2123 length:489 start_codon:yes stop_codon:yes gene_type:complete
MTVDDLIEHFELKKHLESGMFVETYRSQKKIQIDGYEGERYLSSSAMFLLQKGEVSRFHRLKSDETWHFYEGSPVEIIEITKQGQLIRTILGQDYAMGETPVYQIKANHWVAATTLGKFSFFGCSNSPGFDYRDLETTSFENLASLYPQHREVIKKFSYKRA